MLDFRKLWDQGQSFDDFVASSTTHKQLWEGIYRIARLPEWATKVSVPAPRHLLVLAEDWCGDASNTVPIVARWVAAVAGVDLRIIRRDQHPEAMDQYLTNGSRSIPIVIVLDEDFHELGHWGPRPTALQSWVMANRGTIPKTELYPQVRTWYARDRGETTLTEVMRTAGIPVEKVA
jgi:hypothetical protein